MTTGIAVPTKAQTPAPAPPQPMRPAPSSQPTQQAQPSIGLRRYAWGLTFYNVLIVLWGAVVRATGSGNGCGEHWPLCNGTVVQHWQTAANVIEFAHRASVGIALPLLVPLVIWTWRATAKRHLARVFAVASVAFTLTEGLLGALLVVLGLTAESRSPLRAVYLSLHLANTLMLLGSLALTGHFLDRTTGRTRGAIEWRNIYGVTAGLFVTLLVGVSGSLAALADTLFPAHTLGGAFAQEFTQRLAGPLTWLLHLRWLHPATSVLAAVYIGWLVLQAFGRPRLRKLGQAVTGLLIVQMALVVGDVLLLAPTWMQVLHLLGADLLWITVVVLSASICIAPIGCMEGSICSFKRAA